MQEKHAHHILDSRAGLAFLSSGNWWMDGFIDEWTDGWMDGRRRRGKKIMWPMRKRECTGTKYKRDLVKRVHFNDIAALKSLKRQQDQTFPDSLDKAEEWVFPLREIKISRCYCESGEARKSGGFSGSLQGGRQGIRGEADHKKVLQAANLQPTVLLSIT